MSYLASDSSRPSEKLNALHIDFSEVEPLNKVNKLYVLNGKLYFSGTGVSSSGNTITINASDFLGGVTKVEIETLGITGLTTANKNEAGKLESLLNNLANELTTIGFAVDAKIKVIVESKKGYLFLNSDIKVPSNCHLDFVSPVVIGKSFSLRVEGSFNEFPSSIAASPYLTADASFTNTFTIHRNGQNVTTWVSGDILAIRDTAEAKRYDAVIQSITQLTADTYRIVFEKTVAEDFLTGDKVRKYEQGRLGAAIKRGDAKITVANLSASTTLITTGQYIVIKSKRKCGDFVSHNYPDATTGKILRYSDNEFKYEVRKVVRLSRSSNRVYIDIPLSHDYSIDECYILEMNAKQNVTIEGMRVMSLELGTEPRPNNHIKVVSKNAFFMH